MNRVVEKSGLRSSMVFDTAVESATWNEGSKCYEIETLGTKGGDRRSMTAKFLISCTGQLNVPKTPKYATDYVQGRSLSPSSAGGGGPVVMHSAEFDRTVPLAGKTVAIIGNGSTGVQLVESLQPVAGRLLLFQRSPKWGVAKPFYRIPSVVLWTLQNLLPFNLGNRLLRCLCYVWVETLHVAVSKPGVLQRAFQWHLKSSLLKANPEAESMNCLPAYRPGCSRIIVYAGFPKALTQPNVTVVNDAVQGFTPSGQIETRSPSKEGEPDGGKGTTLHDVDVVILATGFTVTDCGPQFKVTNAGGATVQEVWKGAAAKWGGATLFGICTPTFPNFFVIYGPHTNTILGSITFFSECAAAYAAQCVESVLGAGKEKAEVKEEAVARYNGFVRRSFVGRPEMDTCSAWYKGGAGNDIPVTNYPGGMTGYWWATRKWNRADFEVT